MDRPPPLRRPRALARAISTVENRAEGWSELLKALFRIRQGASHRADRPTGAGKSTLVDQLAKHYRKEKQTVGIIAVDPTSPYTAERFWATASACRITTAIRDFHSQHGHTRIARRVGARDRDRRPYLTLPARSGHDRNGGRGAGRSRYCAAGRCHHCDSCAGMATMCRRSKPNHGDRDIFVINKSDREGAERVEREIAPCNRWPCAATGGLRRL